MNRMRRCVLLLLGLTSGICPSALAAPPRGDAAAAGYTIRTAQGSVTRIGAFRTRRDPTIGAAVRVFGRPSSRKLLSRAECQVDWRRLRLRIYFANFGLPPRGETTCNPRVGVAQTFTARSRRFRTWNGLRVGHRSATIRDRHPWAEFRRGTWWLRSARSPFGDESEYPVVDAIVSGGRVRALRGWVGAAGE
jgi:hypothetical protein